MIFKPGEETSKEFPCKIIRKLAGGCMAEIYLANLCNTNHSVVIKGVGAQAPQVQKDILFREADMLKGLRYEGIPEFYGYFEEADRRYFIMSYYEGMNLEQHLRKEGNRVAAEQLALQTASQICKILAYLHGKGIVHGDLKPSNLLMSEDGAVTLLDFGTAEFMDKPRGKYRFQGTLGYAAPECWHRGETALSSATDIFALGATLYYLLEGRKPGECYGNFTLSGENVQKKNRWQYVLDKCCALEAAKRYQSAAGVYKDISQISF